MEEHEFESLSADEVMDALLSDDVDFEGHSGIQAFRHSGIQADVTTQQVTTNQEPPELTRAQQEIARLQQSSNHFSQTCEQTTYISKTMSNGCFV